MTEFNEPIRPQPDSPDLSPAEQHLRMSRIVQQADHLLGSSPWSDSEAAERDYGWPTHSFKRPNFVEIGDVGGFVFLSYREKDSDGNVVQVHTDSIPVNNFDEADVFVDWTDKDFRRHFGLIALSASENEE